MRRALMTALASITVLGSIALAMPAQAAAPNPVQPGMFELPACPRSPTV